MHFSLRSLWLTFPLALLPLVNLQIGAARGMGETTIEILGLALFGAVAEELFFRSFLQNYLRGKCGGREILSALFVNILFAASHVMNLFSYATPVYAAVQTLCAFGVGFSLSAIYARTGKIGICIFIHLLINLTGIFVGFTLTPSETAVYAAVAFMYAAHGWFLLHHEGDIQ